MVRQQTSLELRPYQQECLTAIADTFLTTDTAILAWRQLVTMPTGVGKTVQFASLPTHPPIDTWLSRFPVHQQKMLIIAHREELLDQAAGTMRWANPHLAIEIEQATRKASANADVVIASVQTLAARCGKRMDKFDPDDFRLVVVDEAHHAPAPSYQTVLQYFGFLPPDDWMHAPKPHREAPVDVKQLWQRERLAKWDAEQRPARLLLGVTATPKRGDNIGLEAIFQRVVYAKNIRNMIEEGYLCKLRAFRVESAVSLDHVRTQAGDFHIGELANAIDKDTRNTLAVDAWREHAADRKTIAFCATVEHAEHLALAFRQSGIIAEPIFGSTPTDERRQLLRDFAAGRIQVLTNCNVLTEGFDDKYVGCILHTRPTKSSLLYIQMTGRGTRIAPGKENCIIIDVVDVTRRHSLVSAPDLMGLPAGFDLHGGDLLEAVQQIEDVKAKYGCLDTANLKSLSHLNTVVREVNIWAQVDVPELADSASLTWAKEGDDCYHLWYPTQPGMEPEYINVITDPLGQWEVVLYQGKQRKPMFIGVPTRQQAIALAEDWLRRKRRYAINIVDRQATWRNLAMTPSQEFMLQSYGIAVDRSTTTRGQASILLNRILSTRKTRWR